jgi:ATP-dependent Clp protease ATP-binding subunit ClpC
MGARPLRRAIQRYIEDPLADFVLGRELTPGSTIIVARKNEDEVDIDVIPPTIPEDVQPVTVPPEQPEAREGDDGDSGDGE